MPQHAGARTLILLFVKQSVRDTDKNLLTPGARLYRKPRPHSGCTLDAGEAFACGLQCRQSENASFGLIVVQPASAAYRLFAVILVSGGLYERRGRGARPCPVDRPDKSSG